MTAERDLHGRVVLVTGASRGIGYDVAKLAGARGAQIVAVARTVGGLEELDDEIRKAGGSPATLVPLDLTDFPAIDRLGATIFERWGRLDGLVGNAGILGITSPVPHIKPDVFEKSLAINVTSNYRLIRSMDALLRQSPAPRAVFITSGITPVRLPNWTTYTLGKVALEVIVSIYAAEMKSTPVKVNMINPGPLATKLRAQAFPGEDVSTLKTPGDFAPAVIDMLSPSYTEHAMRVDWERGTTAPL
jgi:NAD(P)-dependent dehydrogenase (short-subunit alcohol dehydrogenase family)